MLISRKCRRKGSAVLLALAAVQFLSMQILLAAYVSPTFVGGAIAALCATFLPLLTRRPLP
jgi:uncharacterized protein (DUF2062 family)